MKMGKNVDEINTLEPVFTKGNIPIVFAADDGYCAIMSVMIQSIIENSSLENFYDIIILNRDISKKNMQLIKDMVNGKDNFAIRFFNVSKLIAMYDFFIGAKSDFSIDTYLRLLIPYVLSENYHKAIYLDGDMIAFDDVAKLMDVDVSGFLLAACRDMSGLGLYYENNSERKKYRDCVLKIRKPDDYFVAGLLVMNLDKFRQEITCEKLLDFSLSRKWQQYDQDILNVLCDNGKAKIIHQQWNLFKPYNIQLIPEACRQEIMEALENPKIIHYGGEGKPWKQEDVLFFDEFWRIALHSPYYNELLRLAVRKRECDIHPEIFNEMMIEHYYKGLAGFRHIFRMILGWLSFKINRFVGKC